MLVVLWLVVIDDCSCQARVILTTKNREIDPDLSMGIQNRNDGSRWGCTTWFVGIVLIQSK